MATLKIATEDDAYLIGGGQGTPVNGKCIIKSRLSNFNCRLKPSSPEYSDNQLVAYDHIERNTPAKEIEWIKCYKLNNGNPSTVEMTGITLCYQSDYEVKFYLRIKYSDDSSTDGTIVTTDMVSDLVFPQNITWGYDNHITLQQSAMADPDHNPCWTIRITDISESAGTIYEGTELIVTYNGQYRSSVSAKNKCMIKAYVDYDLMRSFFVVYGNASDVPVSDVRFNGSSINTISGLAAKVTFVSSASRLYGFNKLDFTDNLSTVSAVAYTPDPDVNFNLTRSTHTYETGSMTIKFKDGMQPNFWYENGTEKTIPEATITVTNYADPLDDPTMASGYPKVDWFSQEERVHFQINLSSLGDYSSVDVDVVYKYQVTGGSLSTYTYRFTNVSNTGQITQYLVMRDVSFITQPTYAGTYTFVNKVV